MVSVLLGYARVSTAEQNANSQTDELSSAGCYEVFVDHASGVLDRRPELEKVLERLRPGDTLVVWRLDQLGRSLRHLIDTVTALSAGVPLVRGVGSLLEREIIRDRTMTELAAARARGRNGGRPSKLSPDQVRAARRLYDEREAHRGADRRHVRGQPHLYI